MNKRYSIIWFLLGLGSQLQLVASLSFTELFVYIAGPLLFFQEVRYMRRYGVSALFWLSILVVLNGIWSYCENSTNPWAILRGMAVACLLPCSIVVTNRLFRKQMNGFKWFFVGVAISAVLCTFVFQQSVELTMHADGVGGVDSAQLIMGGTLYWINRIGPWATLFPKGWYLSCPVFLSASVPVLLAGFAMLTSVSGRSAALGSIGAAMIVLIGGKSRNGIYKRVCRHFWLLCSVGVVAICCFKAAYQLAASNGWLGEKATEKYEKQTRGDTSVMRLLLGGRMESFCGLLACIDKPITGFGPWAIDAYGYQKEFLRRYGAIEDFEKYIDAEAYFARLGMTGRLIPCHSHITMFWLWYGIFGLVFWLYVIYVCIRYIKQDCYAVPQWYMWLAAGLPAFMWEIFFSPPSQRVPEIIMVVAMLMARAVRQGRIELPLEMEMEIKKVEKAR